MAAGPVTLYCRNLDNMDLISLAAATVKIALVSSSYTPDTDSSTGDYLWSDVSGYEITAGNGYSAGGVALSSLTLTAITNGFSFSSNAASWTASGGAIPAWRYAIMYVYGTLWSMTNPLIAYILADTTPADAPATVDGFPLTINCPTPNGWFTKKGV